MKQQKFVFRSADGAHISVNGAFAVQLSTKAPENARWIDITLVKTVYGWACEKVGRSGLAGEVDRFEVILAESDDDLIKQLGQDRLAHQVYDSAGIRNIEWIP